MALGLADRRAGWHHRSANSASPGCRCSASSCRKRPGRACSSPRSSPDLQSNSVQRAGRRSVEFTERWGQLFNYFVFFFFGTVVAGFSGHFTPAVLLYAVLSLTVVRMAPVALALLGTRLSRSTVLFMGWFGPRGLASIVLALVYLVHEAGLAGDSTVRLAVMATVLLSIFAHGLTAQPAINLYAKRIAALDETSPEHQGLGNGSPEPPQTPPIGT